jgi:hypothetical protein
MRDVVLVRPPGKRLGRTTFVVDRSRIASLRAQARLEGDRTRDEVGAGTVLRAAQQEAKPSSENPDETVLAD